jgi:hypothetical protein
MKAIKATLIWAGILLAILIGIGYLMGGCASAPLPEVTPQTKACAGLCGTLEAAQCWEEGTDYEDLFGVGNSLLSCLERCNADNAIMASIDMQCFIQAKGCDMSECVEVR